MSLLFSVFCYCVLLLIRTRNFHATSYRQPYPRLNLHSCIHRNYITMSATDTASARGESSKPITLERTWKRLSETRGLAKTLVDRLCFLEDLHGRTATRVSLIEESLTHLQEESSSTRGIIADIQSLLLSKQQDDDDTSHGSTNSLLEAVTKIGEAKPDSVHLAPSIRAKPLVLP